MTARFTTTGTGLQFSVRLTPKGGRNAVDGWARDSAGAQHLRVRVRAVPEDGKANAALLDLLAGELCIAKSAVALVGGARSRLKTVAATGDTTRLAARLEEFGEA